MGEAMRCPWCWKYVHTFGDYEQMTTSGEWKRMCKRCATRRLNNPYVGLLPLRRWQPREDDK